MLRLSSTNVAPGITDGAANEQAAPAGRPLQVRCTVLVKGANTDAALIVNGPVCPATTVADAVGAVIAKSGTVAEAPVLAVPVSSSVPAMAMVYGPPRA